MPRENRKRGKKHKKQAEEYTEQHEEAQEEPQAGPSWIVPAAESSYNEEAPFGYVDSEVKAYFRTVDIQIREWQEEPRPPQDTLGGDSDPNEEIDRRLFFMAALTEMSGKERQLATDPDCSSILERMAYSMDDFARRVFMDRLTGSYKTLVKHRFASHVCQTFLEVASETIAREARGITPSAPESLEEGELLTMTDMVSDICEEITPDFTHLLMDSFASHVCRVLLVLLMPNLLLAEHKASTLRSKKSAAYKARQGPMKSLFSEGETSQSVTAQMMPPKFRELAMKIITVVREKLSANEVRALAASQVASPVLQLLLEMEAEFGQANQPDSLADRVLDGLVSRVAGSDKEVKDDEGSDYVTTLLRDPTSSHLLETLVRRLSEDAFEIFWNMYLKGKVERLSAHPVANFVLARALERVNQAQLGQACEELEPVSEKLFKNSHTNLIRAMIDSASRVGSSLIPSVVKIVLEGVGLSSNDEDSREQLVPCVLRLVSLDEYTKAAAVPKDQDGREELWKRYKRSRLESKDDPMAPKVRGALILQSMLRLPSPHNQIVFDSLYSLTMDELIAMAHDATASRVLDAILNSSTVSFKERRKFVMRFIGYYHKLVDDRIGSRVVDNCWAFSDPYLREKIARSLIPHERDLVGSYYGKFFARNLNLYLLQRNPGQWKDMQVSQKAVSAKQPEERGQKAAHGASVNSAAKPVPSREREQAVQDRKRKAQPADEIDQVFGTLGKKVTRAELKTDATPAVKTTKEKKRRQDESDTQDKGLKDVLGAIKAAPKDEKRHHKKKRMS